MTVTQNRLATGKKVNTAQDNPTNFFTSQSLQSRAGDLNSLLDSIGQAQQTITAANQGITSLSSLDPVRDLDRQAGAAVHQRRLHLRPHRRHRHGHDQCRYHPHHQLFDAGVVAGGLTGSQFGKSIINASTLAGLSNGDTITVKFGSGQLRLIPRERLNAG